MQQQSWKPLIELLRIRAKIKFAQGLSDIEISKIETRYDFEFPPDLRDFLQTALPYGNDFPDWRNGDEARLRALLDWPRESIVFDVRHGIWFRSAWGERPSDADEAVRHVEKLIAAAPKLIPVCGHRMMPTKPRLAGNPVFSVYQTDIIYYGRDLEAYVKHEFLGERPSNCSDCRPIKFWDMFLS